MGNPKHFLLNRCPKEATLSPQLQQRWTEKLYMGKGQFKGIKTTQGSAESQIIGLEAGCQQSFPPNQTVTGIFKRYVIDFGTRSRIKTCSHKFKRLHKVRGLHVIHNGFDELRNKAVGTGWNCRAQRHRVTHKGTSGWSSETSQQPCQGPSGHRVLPMRLAQESKHHSQSYQVVL